MDPPKIYTAFISEKFSSLINTFKCEVLDVEFLSTRHLMSMAPERLENARFEIRLYLASGDAFCFNSSEESFSFRMPVAQNPVIEASTKSVQDFWDIPNQNPYDRLLITDDIAAWIKSLGGIPRQTLDRIWYDYQNQQRGATFLNPGKPILIKTAFGDVIAKEFLCGRVSFHSAKH
ncbi:hypothetical protein [Cerasicoccus fimbriatus]|uniref:hypothetical protein n=1 Tax=Cerasicoccus fimbriatus TaxID=3014554 RepID=UPI0022B523EE|nr:hypothetical protein [Cerasicoccus sp. TK19100]